MRDVVRTRSVPQIIVSNADYERLTDLATASLERLPEVANELLSEMDRAKVVQDGSVPDNVVRMGSTVTYVDEASGREAAHKLVPATEAKPSDGLLSIDSPVGRALAGAQPGDTRSLKTPKGTRTMRVLGVEHS